MSSEKKELQPIPAIEIKTMTWSKDSHGLFDYESQQNIRSKFQLKTPAVFFRDGNSITMEQTKKLGSSSSKNHCLFEITEGKTNNIQNFLVNPNPKNEIFYIVRTFKNEDGSPKGFPITPGDIIKLGRNEYHILEYKNEDNSTISYTLNTFCEPSQSIYSRDTEETQGPKKTCKICFLEEEPGEKNIESFFITPCKCKGSCEFVHVFCLKRWLQNKITYKAIGNTLHYQWKKFECEVCKEAMPKEVCIDGVCISLVDIRRPELPYIMMENVCREKKVSKGIFLVQLLPSDKIKLGRGHQCDLRISDISVSRFHAYIQFDAGKFTLFDNNSKFGTLVLMQKPHEVTQSKIGIQIGRTIVSLAMKNNDSAGNSKMQQNVTVIDVKEFDTLLKNHSGENLLLKKEILFEEEEPNKKKDGSSDKMDEESIEKF